MRKQLEDAGWYVWHRCTCGGTLTEKYKHPGRPGEQFKVKPNRGTWVYTTKSGQKNSGTKNNLQAKIEKL